MGKKTLTCMTVIGVLLSFATFSCATESIKIGTPLCLTGPYAGDGVGYFRGIEMAVDEINEAGGLLGRPIEILKFDTQDFSPERVMQAADTLVRNKKVHALHCGWAGWGQDVIAYGRYDVPTFVGNGSIGSVSTYRKDPKKYSNWFQLNGIEKDLGIDEAFIMRKIPHDYPNNKVVVISTDDSWGLEIAAGLVEKAKAGGWEIALKEVVPYGTMEWGPVLTKIKKINPAWIKLEIVSAPDLIAFLDQFKRSPTNSLIHFGYGASLPDFYSNIGQEANGVFGNTITIPEPFPTTEAEAWVKKFTVKYGTPPGGTSFLVYTGVYMWAEAVKNTGKVDDYDAINAYLAANEFKTLEGRSVRFDKDHKIPLTTWPGNTFQVQGGKMVTLFLSGTDQTKPVMYKNNKFQIPSWIK